MSSTEKLCFFVCQSIEKETMAVLKTAGFEDVVTVAFPVSCVPPLIEWNVLSDILRKEKIENRSIILVGSNCLRALKEVPEDWAHCRTIMRESCFQFFLNASMIAMYQSAGAYLLTPGWLEQWRPILNKWGFDRKTARGFFGESVKKFVLLDTGVDRGSAEHLKQFGDFIDLPFESIPVGLDYFQLFLTTIVLEMRQDLEKSAVELKGSEENRLTADTVMILDLLDQMTELIDEEKVIESIFQLFTMLFAPASLIYLPLIDGKAGKVRSYPAFSEAQAINSSHLDLPGNYVWIESGEGFILKISRYNKNLGFLQVKGFAFPKYVKSYLNTALNIIGICGLAIENARNFKKIELVNKALEKSAKEKELLLLEAHHRIKNNFTIISSILRAQSLQIKDPADIILFQDSQNRVKTMARLHEALYKFSHITKVDMQSYLSRILNDLISSFRLDEKKILVQSDIRPVNLSSGKATACGLLFNELLTNAIKHGFPDDLKGIPGKKHRIQVDFRQQSDGMIELTVYNTGVSIAEDIDIRSTETLGLSLVWSLVEQIKGQLQVDRTTGTRFTITFRDDEGNLK